LLLGSLFIYNSVNNIDEGAIDKLSLVIQLTKHIRAQSEGDDDPNRLKMYFPYFLWLVRDFALDLSINGRKVSPKEYLDSALQPMKGDPKKVEGRNKVREFIKQFFADRDCFTLVRPVSDEQQLQNLANLSDTDLRLEYRQQLDALKHLIYEKAPPKKMHGQSLNGPMLAELAKSYVESMNSGAVLTISTAWENVVQQECQKALAAAMRTYEAKIATADERGILEQDELQTLHKEAERAATKVFRIKAVGGNYWKLEDELQKFVEEIFERVSLQNYQKSLQSCEQILTNLTRYIDDYITDNKAQAIEQLETEWQKIMDTYNRTAKGPAKASVAAKVLTKKPIETARRTHVNILRVATENFEYRFKSERERHDVEYKRVTGLYDEAVQVRRNLDGLVSQLTRDNADFVKKISNLEEEMRVLLNQSLKMRKKMETVEAEQLQFTKHKTEIETQLKKKGVNLEALHIDSEKCSVM
jgi:DNA repair exonuclease SbcCD ATPase subunit